MRVARSLRRVSSHASRRCRSAEAFSRIADGAYDHVAEQAFFNIGGIEDLERNWARIQAELR